MLCVCYTQFLKSECDPCLSQCTFPMSALTQKGAGWGRGTKTKNAKLCFHIIWLNCVIHLNTCFSYCSVACEHVCLCVCCTSRLQKSGCVNTVIQCLSSSSPFFVCSKLILSKSIYLKVCVFDCLATVCSNHILILKRGKRTERGWSECYSLIVKKKKC